MLPRHASVSRIAGVMGRNWLLTKLAIGVASFLPRVHEVGQRPHYPKYSQYCSKPLVQARGHEGSQLQRHAAQISYLHFVTQATHWELEPVTSL